MGGLFALFTFRTVFMLASTAFSLIFVMLLIGIVTVDEVIVMLNLSPEAANAFKTMMSRIMELSSGILDVISQLLTKLFSWAGVEVDLGQVSIDVNQAASETNGSAEQ